MRAFCFTCRSERLTGVRGRATDAASTTEIGVWVCSECTRGPARPNSGGGRQSSAFTVPTVPMRPRAQRPNAPTCDPTYRFTGPRSDFPSQFAKRSVEEGNQGDRAPLANLGGRLCVRTPDGKRRLWRLYPPTEKQPLTQRWARRSERVPPAEKRSAGRGGTRGVFRSCGTTP